MNYKTKFTLLGFPILHIATGKMENGRPKRGIAKGWIALGDVSFGIILSVGAVAFGGIAVGGLAVGIFSFAGLAIGIVAMGGGAIGVLATGGGAIAWHAATGGFAMANEYALGGETAIANQANNLVAEDYFKNSIFFSSAKIVAEHSRWLMLLVFIPIITSLIHIWKHRSSK